MTTCLVDEMERFSPPMELGYVLRRCPIHDHYIPQFLLPGVSSASQAAQQFPSIVGVSPRVRVPLETRASTDVPVVAERAPVLRHPIVTSPPPVPKFPSVANILENKYINLT